MRTSMLAVAAFICKMACTQGTTKRKIEEETGATIVIPRKSQAVPAPRCDAFLTQGHFAPPCSGSAATAEG
eukprot:5616375-Pyramimonas_sp.AAC.2